MNRRTQQYTLYAAEDRIDQGAVLNGHDDIQNFVIDRMLQTPWWDDTFPGITWIDVGGFEPTRGNQGVAGDIDKNGFAYLEQRSGSSEQEVIHEAAHICARERYGELARNHGPMFARVYLELTYRVRGYEVWNALRQEFKLAGVEFDWDEDNT